MRIITIFKSKKRGGTRYQILIWRDIGGICIKYGKDYGLGSCWETIWPKKRPYYFKIGA